MTDQLVKQVGRAIRTTIVGIAIAILVVIGASILGNRALCNQGNNNAEGLRDLATVIYVEAGKPAGAKDAYNGFIADHQDRDCWP